MNNGDGTSDTPIPVTPATFAIPERGPGAPGADTEPHEPVEESLDPEDWDQLRALGHRMLDDIFAYMEGVRERPVWQPLPDEIRRRFNSPMPTGEAPAGEVYEEFVRNVLPYPMGNIHPRFWGWVMGNGTPLAMLAEMVAAGVNPNMGGGDHAATHVELQVLAWCKQALGFPPDASGLLVSGGSMANLTALVVARNMRMGFDVRSEGLVGSTQLPTIYGSVEMHSSIQKAAEVLGMGSRSLRPVPTDSQFRIDTDALRRQLQEDTRAGMRPVCIVGCAGTVNTGGIDPLNELADIAAEYGAWFHVDGAFGALAYLSPELRPLLAGIERADSLAFDLHKWGYMPFEVGCVLVRSEEAQRRSFSLTPDYLKHATRGLAGGSVWLSDYGVQLTRGFRALKVWMSLKTHGTDKLGRIIRQNVEQARYLASLIESAPQLELIAPVTLNVVCFRYVSPGLDEEGLDALNNELLLRLQESGLAVPSGTRVNGRYALRCAITNHRSRRDDFRLLVEAVERLGAVVAQESLSASKLPA